MAVAKGSRTREALIREICEWRKLPEGAAVNLPFLTPTAIKTMPPHRTGIIYAAYGFIAGALGGALGPISECVLGSGGLPLHGACAIIRLAVFNGIFAAVFFGGTGISASRRARRRHVILLPPE